MKHINHNKLCTIAFKTTGPIPGFHDLIELAVIPMSGFGMDKNLMPFNMRMQPQRPQNAKLSKNQLAEYMMARPPWDVVSIFERWYARLDLRTRKRIIPIGFDLHTLWPFLMDIFMWSDTGENFAEDFFDFSQARSLETLSHTWNDAAWRLNEPYPFQKHNPTYVAYRLGHLYEQNRDALQTARLYGEIWKRYCKVKMPAGVPLEINYPSEIDYSVYSEEDGET